ncbi:MAG: TetR/AcrR family transcriptional regulator [Thermoleophilia bacterium]|nr:TetR/AcrR family transcriptional regulator [Thermoleophilia bacterium]
MSHATLRADAARNRELVLDAAGRLFRERGLDVTMHEIADEAGVGVGTVSRRFHSKDELVAALVEQRMDRLLDVLRRGVQQLDDDPWDAFATAFTDAVELHVQDRGFIEALAAQDRCLPPSDAQRAELIGLLDQLVAGASAVGAIRSDLRATEIPELACMVSRAGASAAGPGSSDTWRRACQVVLDGLRA